MRIILAPLRILSIAISLIIYLTHMGLVWLVIRDRWRRVRVFNRCLGKYSKWGLWLLNVKVTPLGTENLKNRDGALLVGNHLSYLDVLAISSVVPACFVTSTEIKNSPLLGQICQMSGCLFVERRNKFKIHSEVAELSEALKSGLSVVIFPESTSTNGEHILRFRRPLFISAIEAVKPVLPFCQNYRKVCGKPIDVKTRDSVFWYGDMTFVPHLWALASSGGVEMDLHFLPAISTQSQADSRALAEQTQASVERVFIPVKKHEGPLKGPSSGLCES
jgi:lyso-ornithine lipid O-acyltransferase